MLTELKLANFRIFNDEVTVRFRPITVLIGRNSSGKSSIIKFLLMLQQSLGSGRSEFLTPDGDKVQFGDFSGIKNLLTQKDNLFFELATTAQSLSLVDNPLSRYIESDAPIEVSKLVYKTGATIPYSNSSGTRLYLPPLFHLGSGRHLPLHTTGLMAQDMLVSILLTTLQVRCF